MNLIKIQEKDAKQRNKILVVEHENGNQQQLQVNSWHDSIDEGVYTLKNAIAGLVGIDIDAFNYFTVTKKESDYGWAKFTILIDSYFNGLSAKISFEEMQFSSIESYQEDINAIEAKTAEDGIDRPGVVKSIIRKINFAFAWQSLNNKIADNFAVISLPEEIINEQLKLDL